MAGNLTHVFLATLMVIAAENAFGATHWEAYVYSSDAALASVQAVVRMIDTVRQQSNGELEIHLHLGGTLPVKAADIATSVRNNIIQIGDDGFPTTFSFTGVLRLPMLLQDYQDVEKAMSILRPYLDDAYGKRGIVVLGQYAYPVQMIFSRSKITSLRAFAGMKVCVTTVEQNEFVQRLGGVPTMFNPSEAMTVPMCGMAQGIISAAANNDLIGRGLLKYRYALPVSYSSSTIIANRDAFEKLPPATQKALRDAAAASTAWATTAMRHEEDENTTRLGNDGTLLTDPSRGEIVQATDKARPYWYQWASAHSAEATQIVNEIRAAVGR